MREIKEIIVHCADTYASMDIGAEEIEQWHLNRGWSGIGYHYVIRRNGVIQTGRDLDGDGDIDEEVGAHALGHNAHSIGVCLVGGKGDDDQPDCNFTLAQWESVAKLVADLEARYPGAKVIGHRDVSQKACPTFNVGAWWYG